MKVAIADSWFHWPPVGGAIRSVKEIADRLSKKGVDVTIIAPPYGIKGLENSAFALKELKIRGLSGKTFYSAVKESINEIDPDVVFVTSGNLMKPYMIEASSGYPTLVRLYAYELRCPASYGLLYRDGHICEYSFLHQPLRCMTCSEDIRRVYYNTGLVDRPEFFASYKFAYPFYHWLVKRTVGNITMAVATSRYMKQQFAGIIPLDRIRILPDGVDSDFFSPRPKEARTDGVKVISLPGRTFDPIKGLDVLLKALLLLWKKRQDFRLVVTGSKRQDIASLPFLASDSWLDDKDIPGMYSNSDIVVVPSIWGEPFGLTALEAMSCEIPVIASKVGGLQETISDGVNGLLFEPGNHNELAERLDFLLDDDDLRIRMGRIGREFVVKNYSWGKIIEEYMKMLNILKSTPIHK